MTATKISAVFCDAADSFFDTHDQVKGAFRGVNARGEVRAPGKITFALQRCFFARTFAQATEIACLCQKRPYAAMAQISRQDDSRRPDPYVLVRT